jgi:hypothetical protein
MATRRILRSLFVSGEGKLTARCVSCGIGVDWSPPWSWCSLQTPPGAKAIRPQPSTGQRGAPANLLIEPCTQHMLLGAGTSH